MDLFDYRSLMGFELIIEPTGTPQFMHIVELYDDGARRIVAEVRPRAGGFVLLEVATGAPISDVSFLTIEQARDEYARLTYY